MAWLATRPTGASAEVLVDVLWPELAPKAAQQRLWVTLSSIRKFTGTGTSDAAVVVRSGSLYRLDAHLVSCDIWRLEAALRTAATSGDDTAVASSLEEVRARYEGHFAEDLDGLWVEPLREGLRRQVLEAHLRLADRYEATGSPERAAGVLARALELDPDAHETLARLIALHETLGNPVAARHVREASHERERRLAR